MSGKEAISGRLEFIGLADLFQLLGGNASSGLLRMTSPHTPDPGIIFFENGTPVNGSWGARKGLDAVYALFGWKEGRFEFHEEEVRTEKLIKTSRMQIVLDALRMLDDGDIEAIGPAEESVEPAPGRAGALQGEDRVIKGAWVDYLHILDEEVFKDGERIVREEGHGKWIWVILEGRARVIRETSKGPLNVAILGEGCFVGNFSALVFQEYARSANVVAQGEVRLGLLDTEQLSSEYASLSEAMRRLLLSLDKRLRRTTDRAVEMALKRHKDWPAFTKEHRIVRQGSSREDLYRIAQGQAYVAAKDANGFLPLITLKKNEFLGFIPFTDTGQEPRGAGVFGSKEIEIEKIDTKDLLEEYNTLSGTIRNLIYNVGVCTAVTTRWIRRIHEGR